MNSAILALPTCVGHTQVTDTYWYLTGIPELMTIAAQCFEPFATGGRSMNAPTASINLAPLVQQFFTERLMAQSNVSPRTVAVTGISCGCCWCGLYKRPEQLALTDLDATRIAAFLDYLKHGPFQQPKRWRPNGIPELVNIHDFIDPS